MNDSSSSPAVPRQWVFALYTGAILVRLVLAVLFGDHEPQIVDAKDYNHLAAGLLEQGSYVSESGELISLRPPLYPALVAIVYYVFGANNWLAVCLVQSAISLGTVVLTQRIGTRLAGARVGFLAALIVAFYPSLLAFNCLVLSETLFTFLFVGAIWATIRIMEQASWTDAIVLGVCLGLGALTRSILWACTPPLLLYLLLTMKGTLVQRIGHLVVVGIVFATILAPWAYRNTKLHRTFTIVDVMGGRNVMMGNYEYTPLERSWATVSDVKGDKAWHVVLRNSTPDYAQLTQGQIDKRAMKYGIRYFFTHPSQTTKRCVVRFFNFWQLERTISAGLQSGIWGEVSKPTFLIASGLFCGSYAIVVCLAIFGIVCSGMSWRQLGLLLLWIALPCAIHTIAFAHSRYHLPAIPVLAVFAAQFVVVQSRPSPVRTRQWILAGMLCLGLVLGWVRELVWVDFAILG